MPLIKKKETIQTALLSYILECYIQQYNYKFQCSAVASVFNSPKIKERKNEIEWSLVSLIEVK